MVNYLCRVFNGHLDKLTKQKIKITKSVKIPRYFKKKKKNNKNNKPQRKYCE